MGICRQASVEGRLIFDAIEKNRGRGGPGEQRVPTSRSLSCEDRARSLSATPRTYPRSETERSSLQANRQKSTRPMLREIDAARMPPAFEKDGIMIGTVGKGVKTKGGYECEDD